MSSITLPLIDPMSWLLGPILGDDVSFAGGANGVGAVSDGLSLGLGDGSIESVGETVFEIGGPGFVGLLGVSLGVIMSGFGCPVGLESWDSVGIDVTELAGSSLGDILSVFGGPCGTGGTGLGLI